MDLLLVLVAGWFAGTLGGIVGTGSSLVLMPIPVVMFGPRHAVPTTVPLFTFHGLERGVFLGTEAAGSIGVYLAKVATFQALGAFPLEVLVQGLGVGATLMAGSFAGRFVVLRVSPAAYRSLIDGLMLCSGLSLLSAAVR